VRNDDGLPTMICQKCFTKLSNAYNLKTLAEASYLMLLDSLIKKDTDYDKVAFIKKDLDETSDSNGYHDNDITFEDHTGDLKNWFGLIMCKIDMNDHFRFCFT
jgi:hypothetical protein